mmetsp:Transcript_11048/g.34179  ORF Transcript_11048/g.34179 Transcript_11048/m.34179 type:complete len:247 (-) Transcript_11048:399-1139(-)
MVRRSKRKETGSLPSLWTPRASRRGAELFVAVDIEGCRDPVERGPVRQRQPQHGEEPEHAAGQEEVVDTVVAAVRRHDKREGDKVWHVEPLAHLAIFVGVRHYPRGKASVEGVFCRLVVMRVRHETSNARGTDRRCRRVALRRKHARAVADGCGVDVVLDTCRQFDAPASVLARRVHSQVAHDGWRRTCGLLQVGIDELLPTEVREVPARLGKPPFHEVEHVPRREGGHCPDVPSGEGDREKGPQE